MFHAQAAAPPLLGWLTANEQSVLNFNTHTMTNKNYGVYILAYGSFDSSNVVDGATHHQILQSLIDQAIETLGIKWASDAHNAEERVVHMEHQQEIRSMCEKAVKVACQDDIQRFYMAWPNVEKMLDAALGSSETVKYARSTLASIKRHNAGMKNYLTSKHAHLCKQMEGNEDLFDVDMHINMTLVHSFCNKTYARKLDDLIDLAARVLVVDDADTWIVQKKYTLNGNTEHTQNPMMSGTCFMKPNGVTFFGGHDDLKSTQRTALNHIINAHSEEEQNDYMAFFDSDKRYQQLHPHMLPLVIQTNDKLHTQMDFIDCLAIGTPHQDFLHDAEDSQARADAIQDLQQVNDDFIWKTTLASSFFVHPVFVSHSQVQQLDLSLSDPTIWKLRHGWHSEFVRKTKIRGNPEFDNIEDVTGDDNNLHVEFASIDDAGGIRSVFLKHAHGAVTSDVAANGDWYYAGTVSAPVASLRTVKHNINIHRCPLWNNVTSDSAFYKLVPVSDDAGPVDGCVDFDNAYGWHTGTSASAVIDVFYAIQTFLHDKIDLLTKP